jgi:hypothetical protein
MKIQDLFKYKFALIAVLIMFLLTGATALAQTTSFSYQGRLADAGQGANGAYQFQFKLFDAVSGGNQIGAPITDLTANVTNGSFTVQLDFGAAAFDGGERYLEISIRRAGEVNYTPLNPRQEIASAPYAVRANSAANSETFNGNLSGYVSNPQTDATAANASTANAPETIVKRDENGKIAVGGIVFDDGTVMKSAAASSTTANLAGTGTTNRIPKWLDTNGTLSDSVLSESGGNMVVNGGNIQMTATPSSVVDSNVLFTDSNAKTLGMIASSTPSFTSYNGSYLAMRGNNYSMIPNQRGLISFSAGNVASPVGNEGSILFLTGLDQLRMSIKPSGNVGIGTATPAAKLDVAGNIKLTGANSALVFPDGTSMTTAPTGPGGTMTGTSIVSAINDSTTAGVINENRLSFNVARLNGANNWTGLNVFGAGLSANNALITNVGNPVNAGDATNKAYTDANFVKFVPGTEQLSVGDANGTAPMINLRGGSTCCSGPGGHTPAWFKVFQNGSFVATGNLGVGVSPMQGKGYRTSWDSYKGAFRSGFADNEWDDATVGFFSWAGGSNSTAEGLYAFAFGDTNFARSTSSIAFGSSNEVKGAAGFAAGSVNRVCDTYGVAFGNKAQSGGPLINGKCDPDTFNIRGLAAVAIGYNVTASQDHTTAMGKFASNNNFSGTFIWSDGSATASADTFKNNANNEFAARATGGFRFRTNLGGTTGCNLPAGSGVFNCTSSRTTKENFLPVNGTDVLSRLRKVPVSTWNYITEGQRVRHLGPMAEDFHKEFGLGTDDKSIGVQDMAGVSLAAVKELDAQLQQKTSEVETLKAEVNSLQLRLAALEQTVQKLAREQK